MFSSQEQHSLLVQPLLSSLLSPLLSSPLSARVGFQVSSLFAANEQGAWYDPSDFSTMYQDSAGTTPVTAVGQPVGMILDKRLGVVRGAERVPALDAGNFTPANATLTNPVPGQLTVTNNAALEGSAVVPVYSATAGLSYEVIATCVGLAGTTSAFVVVGNANMPLTGPGTFRRIITPTGTGAIRLAVGTTTIGHAVTVSAMSVKELPGNHAIQATSASRPVLQQDGSGFYHLLFDGVDDSLATAAIDFTATDKMTVFAGVHKASDASTGFVCELSTQSSTNPGAFRVNAPSAAANPNYTASAGGTILSSVGVAGYPAPITNVLSFQNDIAADSLLLRVNGALAATSATDQGTGNFGNYPLFIGSRSGPVSVLNGRIYSLIVRGAASSAAQIASAERYVASRTGVTL